MKTINIIICCILMLFCYTLIGQNKNLIWAPIGATWEYEKFGVGGPLGKCTIAVIKDTIIKNVASKVLASNCLLNESRYYISVKEDKVFYWLKDSLLPLYDFKSTKYDTVLVGTFNPAINKVIVLKSLKIHDTIIIIANSKFRKYHTTYNIKDGFILPSNVIDLFGSLDFLFPKEALLDISFNLSSYQDTCWLINILKSFNNYKGEFDFSFQVNKSCLVSGFRSEVDLELVSIFPNPLSNKLFLKSINKPIKMVKVVDFTGRVIKHWSGFESNNIELEIHNVPNGLYLIEIKLGIVSVFKKVFVQN